MSTDKSSAHDRVDGEPSGAEPAAGRGRRQVAAGRYPSGDDRPHSDDQPDGNDRPDGDDRRDGDEQPGGEIGYAAVARRISGWTTNLLATAVVVLIAVLFGRQLIALWRPAGPIATPPAEQQLAAFDDPYTPIQIQFGDSPMLLHRQAFLGDVDAAVQQLCRACAEQLKKLPLPASQTVPVAEAALLARVMKRPPLKRVPPDGALYQLDDSMPVVVGTKRPAGGLPDGSVGNLTERVVTWGIAVPGPDEGWTLYSFGMQGDELRTGTAQPGDAAVPLPPGAERILTMRWPGGGGVTAFCGAGGPDQWPRFFDQWFADRNAEPTLAWRVQGDSMYARYALPVGDRILSVDIQFSPGRPEETTETTQWRGMIAETPGSD